MSHFPYRGVPYPSLSGDLGGATHEAKAGWTMVKNDAFPRDTFEAVYCSKVNEQGGPSSGSYMKCHGVQRNTDTSYDDDPRLVFVRQDGSVLQNAPAIAEALPDHSAFTSVLPPNTCAFSIDEGKHWVGAGSSKGFNCKLDHYTFTMLE